MYLVCVDIRYLKYLFHKLRRLVVRFLYWLYFGSHVSNKKNGECELIVTYYSTISGFVFLCDNFNLEYIIVFWQNYYVYSLM